MMILILLAQKPHLTNKLTAVMIAIFNLRLFYAKNLLKKKYLILMLIGNNRVT